jgi:hypothetical protein
VVYKEMKNGGCEDFRLMTRLIPRNNKGILALMFEFLIGRVLKIC